MDNSSCWNLCLTDWEPTFEPTCGIARTCTCYNALTMTWQISPQPHSYIHGWVWINILYICIMF